MKKVEATIQPFTLDAVRDALVAAGIEGMSMSEVKGLDPHAHSAWYRGSEYVVWFGPRIKIEIVVADIDVNRCIAAIERNARTAAGENGEIVVVPVDEAITIRTGERMARVARAA